MPKRIVVGLYADISDNDWMILKTLLYLLKRRDGYVDIQSIVSNCRLRSSCSQIKDILRNFVDSRLVAFEKTGYRLTLLGYDYLALNHFITHGYVSDLNRFGIIGVGKESDVYATTGGAICQEFNCEIVCLKFHRLGRTSFKAARTKRDYIKSNEKATWAEMNEKSAIKEFNAMKLLYEADFPIPTPIERFGGAVCMAYVENSILLSKFNRELLESVAGYSLYMQARYLMIKLLENGLIHGDFNEFNLLVKTQSSIKFDPFETDEIDEDDESSNEEEDIDIEEASHNDEVVDNEDCPYFNDDPESFELILIDFPQAISRDSAEAKEIYRRDSNCLVEFFSKFIKISEEDLPPKDIEEIERKSILDVHLEASGSMRLKEAMKLVEENNWRTFEDVIEKKKKKDPKVMTKKQLMKKYENASARRPNKVAKQVRNKMKQENHFNKKNEDYD